jgi:cation:H+ antiporter
LVAERTYPAVPTDGPGGASWGWNLGLVAGGLALLVLGAHWFIEAAVGMARLLGVSELIIGLTIVAGGTSLPELATSVLASLRGERDIAVGNVVGSNLFNLFGVLGLRAWRNGQPPDAIEPGEPE